MADITWTTLEFEEKERHPDWIWYAGLVAAIVATISFFYGNIFFGIFAIIAGAIVIIYSFHSPKPITVIIGEKGVQINHELVPYDTISQFWLDESGKQDKLLLLVKTVFMPMVVLPIEGVTADSIRTALTAFIPEVEMRDSTSVKIFDRLGF